MIPGMLMKAWRQECSRMLELEKKVKLLTKKRRRWKLRKKR